MTTKSHRHLAIVHDSFDHRESRWGAFSDLQADGGALDTVQGRNKAPSGLVSPQHPSSQQGASSEQRSSEQRSLEQGALSETQERWGGSPEASEVLQVGELAKLTGKTVRALHLYEKMGLLSPVERTRGRFRLFNADSVERVRWIVKLQTVGFSLPEIQAIVREQEAAGSAVEAAARLRTVYMERLAAVQGKLKELHRLERELLSSLTYLDACQSACSSDVDTAACPSCGRHIDQPEQPPLVAGLHVS